MRLHAHPETHALLLLQLALILILIGIEISATRTVIKVVASHLFEFLLLLAHFHPVYHAIWSSRHRLKLLP